MRGLNPWRPARSLAIPQYGTGAAVLSFFANFLDGDPKGLANLKDLLKQSNVEVKAQVAS